MIGPGSDEPVRAALPRGMDPAEQDFYHAVHYLSGAAWLLGAGREALAALQAVVAEAMRATEGDRSSRDGSLTAREAPTRGVPG